jgi:hypothetical protein
MGFCAWGAANVIAIVAVHVRDCKMTFWQPFRISAAMLIWKENSLDKVRWSHPRAF